MSKKRRPRIKPISSQRRPYLEILERRRLLSASSGNEPIPLATIHQYGMALFGQDWPSDLGIGAAEIQQHVLDDTWRSMLNESTAPTIANIREEAQYIGAEILQAQVSQALSNANLRSVDIRELDWLQDQLQGPGEDSDYFSDGESSDDPASEGELDDPPLAIMRALEYEAYEGNPITPGVNGLIGVVVGFQGELPEGGFNVPWTASPDPTATFQATPGVDFVATSGSVLFTDSSEGDKTITFAIINDTQDEPDERFEVELNAPVVPGFGASRVTILENDLHVAIADAEPVTEGDIQFEWPDPPMARFQVTISSPRSEDVSIPWRIAPVDPPLWPATPGSDFIRPTTINPEIDGYLIIEVGQTEGFIEIPIIGDQLYELTEYFNVDIATAYLHHILYTVDDERGLGTINDNDPFPELSVDDVSVEEDAGTATLTVTMTNRSSFPVTFDWAVTDQTAIRPDDYDRGEISGTVTVPAGGAPDPHLEQFVFTIVNDILTEPDETFQLTISNAVQATITKANGVVTILANDPQVDIDVDSNNNGAIEEADDPIEEDAPGNVIPQNVDDDNENGIIDSQESGPLNLPDDDLLPVNLAFIQLGLPQDELDRLRIVLTISDINRVRVWDTATKDNLVASETAWTVDQVPASLFMEGISSGNATLLLRLVRIEGEFPLPIVPDLNAATLMHSDVVLVLVSYVNLTGHTPYTDPFQLRTIAEVNEENPGIHIRRNGDDDNNNEVSDRVDPHVGSNENDLIRVRLEVPNPIPNGLRLELERGPDIRVWTSSEKGTQLLGATNPDILTQAPSFVWVEWVTPGTAAGQSNLELRLVDNVSNNVVTTDTLVFRPFSSIVIVLGGEFQAPTDPADSNHGTFRTAIELYADNYDVHMYDEDTMGNEVIPMTDGEPYREVVSAIQNRGVTDVAIFGYSHGGGSTLHLSAQLDLNRNSIGTFTISFTAYIDGVVDGGIEQERTWPPGTQNHVSIFQNGSVVDGFLDGGPVVGAENINVEDDWGLTMTHGNIDDNDQVRNLIMNRLENFLPNR